MSLNRYAARRDANEQELIAEARKLGWWLIPLSRPVDWLGYWRGVWLPIEIKSGSGTLTEAQETFIELADARGAPVLIWRTLDDVVECSK